MISSLSRGKFDCGVRRERFVSELIIRWEAVRCFRAEMTWADVNAGFKGTCTWVSFRWGHLYDETRVLIVVRLRRIYRRTDSKQ